MAQLTESLRRQPGIDAMVSVPASELDDCEDGDRRACDDARDTYAEMQQIIPTIPYEPEDD